MQKIQRLGNNFLWAMHILLGEGQFAKALVNYITVIVPNQDKQREALQRIEREMLSLSTIIWGSLIASC